MKAYKKSLWIVAASAALAATFVWNSVSLGTPEPAAKPSRDAAKMERADVQLPGPGDAVIEASGGAICDCTGFEAGPDCGWELGWICGSTFTACPGPPIPGSCTGDPLVDGDCCITNPNPLNGWYVSATNQHCGHPYITTVNPSASAGGTQHVRFEQDPAGGNPPGCTGFGGACRVNAFTPTAGAYPPAPSTVTMDVSMSAPFFDPALKGSLTYFTVDDGNGGLNMYLYFHYYGLWFVYDYALLDFAFAGYLYGSGAYAQYKVEYNPCPQGACEAGVDTTGCPVKYYVDYFDGNGSNLTYATAVPGGGLNVSRAIFAGNNIAANELDVDNYCVSRGVTCPTECGNGIVETGEDCEPGVAGPCPDGRCAADCTCTPICTGAEPCPLVNGDNGPFIAPFDPAFGGIWHYDGDAANLAYDMCDSAGLASVDTLIRVYDDAAQLASNDDCCDPADPNCGATFGAGSTPNAECYNNVGPPTWASCTCAPNTNPAYGHDVQLARIAAIGDQIFIHVSKKAVCGGEFAGSCCVLETETCTDNVPQSACTGNFSADLKCADVDCTLPRGSCCNSAPGAGGACMDGVLEADCTGANLTWTAGGSCPGDPACAEVQGACCNRLLGSCSQTIQGACNCADCVWTQGAACGSVPCNAIQGACCVRTDLDATCEQTSQAGCDAAGGEWSRETDCANVTCEPLFTPIPTVSEWGLVIMALLLLVGGKVYFGRRQVATA